MSYPSILTIWDGDPATEASLRVAAEMARTADGHVDMLCMGVDRLPGGFYSMEMARELVPELRQRAAEDAKRLGEEARGLLDREGVAGAVRVAVVRFDELKRVVGREGRFHDLVVTPKPYGREDEELPEAFLEASMFETAAPVLVVPADAGEKFGERVMIAWNGGLEAVRAVRAAIPLLKRASEVRIVTIDPPERPSDRADPSRDLATMLSRHGVSAEIVNAPKSAPTIAETLNRYASEMGADLTIMGAYGHSRLRERMLGGATRDMLKATKIPVLLAH